MDALIAKADAIQPLGKKRKTTHAASQKGAKRSKDSSSSDHTLHSITKHTSLPKSFSKLPEAAPTHSHIANKKLRTELNRHSAQAAQAKELLKDAEMLLADEAGKIEVEGEMERTWRVGQKEIVQGAGQEAARGRREWKLDGGPYRSRYTRNGRFVVFDFQGYIRLNYLL
jgi:U3 small nucleolar RNA-associated protein 7